MSQNTSHRIGFKFWLNLDKENEEVIADTIEHLKSNRSFTETIRNGIRLIVDLQAGKTDVLFQLFPFVKAKLESSSSGGSDTGNLSRDIARLETLILKQGTSTNNQIMKPVSGSLQQIGGIKPLAIPVFDEDEDDGLLTVTKHEGAGLQANMNFLKSIQGLQQ